MVGPRTPDDERRSQSAPDYSDEPRPPIAFADALLACHKLSPQNRATGRQIIEMLGLAGEHTTPAPVNVGASKPSSTDRASTPPQTHDNRYLRPTDPDHGRRPPPLSGAPRPSTLRSVSRTTAAIQPPTWLGAVDPLGPLAEANIRREVTPLFGRTQRRGILSAAVATSIEEGDLDVNAAIATLAAGRPLTEIPRALRETTRRGAHLLLDRGNGMTPFRNDLRQLVEALDHILGDDHVLVNQFIGCPSRGLTPSPPSRSNTALVEAASWRSQRPGAPIIVITDLGIGGMLLDEDRATVAEWVAFAQSVHRSGSTLVGFVPYEAARWPAAVARVMALLHWSERTTASQVRHAMRDANRRLA